MTDTVKTFHWTSDADSFTFTPNGDGTATWSASGGDVDAGCLQNELSGRNKADTGAWTRTLTFEDMGVTAGDTVSAITSASIQSKVTVYGSVDNLTIGNVTLSDGSTTVVLAASRTPTGTDSVYQTQSGTNDTGLSWASTQSVTITINQNLDNANAAGQQIAFYLDTLTLTITHASTGVNELDFERGTGRGIMRGVGRGI